MATPIWFEHTTGWRAQAKVIEQPRNNPLWQVQTVSDTQVVLTLAGATRRYQIREWLNNDKCYADLQEEVHA